MKQMCGRGKFFVTPGIPPNGKLRKFDDNRFFLYEGFHYGSPYGPPFPSADSALASASRATFNPSGSFFADNSK